MVHTIAFYTAIILFVLGVITLFNKGVTLKNYVKEAFATMDVYLKKRWDLIPNLLETVKGYSQFEQSTLEKITQLRNANYSTLSHEQKMELNNQIGIGLSKLIAVAENYPDLKANQSFVKLMDDLSKLEDDIANARKYYNATVREFNTYTEVFPTNVISKVFNFKPEKMFEITEEERQNIGIKF